jgi:hypothetical protein
MGIVKIKGVGEVAVVERGRRGCIVLWIPDHTSDPSCEAQYGQRAGYGFIEVSGVTRAKRNANMVHYQELGTLNDVSRYILEIQASNESRQSCGF